MKLNVLTMLAVSARRDRHGRRSSARRSPPAGASKFEAGKHYQVLTPAQPTSSDTGKIEVAEVFMFGCPGCFGFEPHLQSWLPKLPDDVSFVRIPAPWNATADLHARAYYTAQALGKTHEIEGPLFNEFHVKHNYLDSEDKLAAFFKQFGVDDTTFRNTFESFAVDAKVGRAQDLVKRYQRAEHAERRRERQVPHERQHGRQLRNVVRDHRRADRQRARGEQALELRQRQAQEPRAERVPRRHAVQREHRDVIDQHRAERDREHVGALVRAPVP